MLSLSKLLNGCVVISLLLVTGCSTTQTPDATAVAQAVQTELAIQVVTQTQAAQNVATQVAATLTAQPTDTAVPTQTPTHTFTPSPTASPTATALPTSTATATATAAPSKVPVVVTVPTVTKTPSSAGSGGPLYGFASGGPQGYTSELTCTQAGGVPCESVMAPGDISFGILLWSTPDALLAIFVPFGLAVEKDGANAADMYMTVDSGWLEPGGAAYMGTSRRFSQPGHYIIRTNGCLITQASYPNCTWWTVNGTVVTFDIR